MRACWAQRPQERPSFATLITWLQGIARGKDALLLMMPFICSCNALPPSEERAERKCVICMSEPRVVVARPCRHCTMCEPCSQLVRNCPICRQPFERAVVLAAPPAAPQPASHWHGGLASTAKKTESVVNADSEEDDSENCKPEFDSTHQEINYTIHVVSKSPYMSVALER
jgi:hypothetical protein